MIGKTVSHYKIIEKIGSGGMGTVYKAQDTKLDRFVALKFLPLHLSQAEEEKRRFIHEAKAASALDHPNICNIYEIDETKDGQMFIVMACYEGESLKERIDRGPLPVDEAIDIAVQIAKGLEKAHSKEIVHRDIKPANVLITKDGQVKIVDFGLAKLAGITILTKEGTTLGTVAYMSPEQTQGTKVDHRTDIWALGVILYEMLTGERPFKGDYEQAVMYSIINEEPIPVKKVNPAVPPDLEKIVSKSLLKNPELRYTSAAELVKDLKEYRDNLHAIELEAFDFRTFLRRIRQPHILLPAVGLILLIILAAVWFFNRQAKIRWASEDAIPEVSRLIESGLENYIRAYQLAEEAEKYIPDNKKLKDLLSQCAVHTSIRTFPAGAKIYMKEYTTPEKNWKFIGVSPIENIRLAAGYFRCKIEKEGYETITALSSGFTFSTEAGFVPFDIQFTLDEKGKIPPEMVRVSGSDDQDDFFIDRYEVTNIQFKEFIDRGGYQNRAYWKNEFIQDGSVLPWKETIAEFVDQTGRPGPSTWQAGNYPDGAANYPVSGISWFEAAAYAEYAGKSLPTIFHWNRARGITSSYLNSYIIISFSNFGSEGLSPVGSYPGITAFGLYDMAGNVREWCWNETRMGRCIRGGAWDDYLYMFDNISQISPFDRSAKNGFRCVRYLEKEKIPDDLFGKYEYQRYSRDYYHEKPVSDAIFQVYKDQFSYDPKDLNPQLEMKDESSEAWIKERISFDAAYGEERMIANIFLPRNTALPFQVVIFFPGSSALYVNSSEELEKKPGFQYYLSHIVRNRRAVVYPVYQGTFERMFTKQTSWEEDSHKYAEYIIQLVNDLSRVIDYLETRPDIAAEKIAFYGLSWGGQMGLIIPAVEDRIQANMLIVGGLLPYKPRPEVNQINFISRVKIPTLLLNGRYDMVFPYEASVKPMYELLGTPEENKKLVLYDTDHFIPRNELIKETLDWLDRYLGPIK
jgi:serine/threonine protein kinase/formylglycine-generating enzyme required for sulfatase activity/predicted esterase